MSLVSHKQILGGIKNMPTYDETLSDLTGLYEFCGQEEADQLA